MATIQYLRLDATNDPVFVPQASLTDLDAVAQAIQTRLLLFEGEWWENLNIGTPMFQSILDQSAVPKNQQVMSVALAQRISGTPYVSAVSNQQAVYNPQTRRFTYTATAQTSFGPVPVTTTPGSSGSISGGQS